LIGINNASVVDYGLRSCPMTPSVRHRGGRFSASHTSARTHRRKLTVSSCCWRLLVIRGWANSIRCA